MSTLKITMIQVLFLAAAFEDLHSTLRSSIIDSLIIKKSLYSAGRSGTRLGRNMIREWAACNGPYRQLETHHTPLHGED